MYTILPFATVVIITIIVIIIHNLTSPTAISFSLFVPSFTFRLIQDIYAMATMSFATLATGRPTLRFPVLGRHSVKALIHYYLLQPRAIKVESNFTPTALINVLRVHERSQSINRCFMRKLLSNFVKWQRF